LLTVLYKFLRLPLKETKVSASLLPLNPSFFVYKILDKREGLKGHNGSGTRRALGTVGFLKREGLKGVSEAETVGFL
jgi:hypothetical protein